MSQSSPQPAGFCSGSVSVPFRFYLQIKVQFCPEWGLGQKGESKEITCKIVEGWLERMKMQTIVSRQPELVMSRGNLMRAKWGKRDLRILRICLTKCFDAHQEGDGSLSRAAVPAKAFLSISPSSHCGPATITTATRIPSWGLGLYCSSFFFW